MILTPQQFFARYHVSAAYASWRRAHPHPDDLLEEPEALVAPLVVTEPPLFADTLPLTDEVDEEFDDPEWTQDFDPWILEAIRKYEMEEQR